MHAELSKLKTICFERVDSDENASKLYKQITDGQEVKLLGIDEVGYGALAGPLYCAVVDIPEALIHYNALYYKQINDSKSISAQNREELCFFIQKNCQYSLNYIDPQVIDTINVLRANQYCMLKCVQNHLLHTDLYINLKIAGLSTELSSVINSSQNLNIFDISSDEQRYIEEAPIIVILVDGNRNPADFFRYKKLHLQGDLSITSSDHISAFSGNTKEKINNSILYSNNILSNLNKLVFIEKLLLIGKLFFLPIVGGDKHFKSISAASIIAKVTRDKFMSELATAAEYHYYKWDKNKGYGTKQHTGAIRDFGLSDWHRRSFCGNFI